MKWAALACGYAVTMLYLVFHGKSRQALWLTAGMLVLILWVLLLISAPVPDGYSLPEGKVHQHDHRDR